MFKKSLLIAGFALLIFAGRQPGALASFAEPHREFSRQFNLVVHQGNVDRVVSRGKVLEVLLNYFKANLPRPLLAYEGDQRLLFADVRPSHALFAELIKACDYQLFNCQKNNFNPYQSISQKDLLTWFFRLKDGDNQNYWSVRPDQNYRRAWVVSRHMNILPKGQEVTYDFLSELLYRDSVAQQNFNQPYVAGLVPDLEEINSKNFHNMAEIDTILQKFYNQIFALRKEGSLFPEEVQYLSNLEQHQEAYRRLKNNLLDHPYLLRMNPYYSEDIAKVIRKYGLQEILVEYHYDYSKNAAYRQHNLATGISKMHGVVVMPGEEVSFWNILSANGLSEFTYGWVIVNGGQSEEWQFGGGICGAASGVFNPVWRAGLKILERKQHSVYYPSLYPMEDIGLDATVYRPRPDFRFKNNFETPIVFAVENRTEDKMIRLQILGNSPYRNFDIKGPIFKTKKDVEWVRRMEYFDGTVVEEVLASHYNAIH